MAFDDTPRSKRRLDDEEKDVEEDEELVVIPPDGGWGWMVVFGSFMIHVIADGISYSFGVVIKELLAEFDEGKGPTSWIVSILIGVTLMSGPMASAITNRFGCRSTTMVGGVIATIGTFLSYFGGSIFFLIITMGVITGIGFGLMYCPAIIIVTVYFEKRRALATGIAVAGAGVGTLIFPPFTAYLMQQYTWRGTFFIYAGIIFNCVVCGALFRAPPTQRISKMKNGNNDVIKNGKISAAPAEVYAHAGGLILDAIAEGEEEELEKQCQRNQVTESAPETTNVSPQKPAPFGSDTPDIVISSADDVRLASVVCPEFDRQTSVPIQANGAGDGRCFSSDHIPGGPNRPNPPQPRNHLGGIPSHSWSVMPQMDGTHFSHRSGITAILAAAATLRRRGTSECQHTAFGHSGPTAVLNRKDIFYRGSVTNLPEYKSNPQIYRSQTSLHRPPSVPHDTSLPDYCHEYSSTGLSAEVAALAPSASGLKEIWIDVKDTLRQMIDMRILKDVLFILFAISNFLTSVGMTPPLVFLPDRAVQLGLDNDDFLLSIYGIFNTLGRLAIGWASDQRWANRLMIYNVSLSVGGVGTILSFLCRTFGWLSFYAGFYGLALSAYISLTSVILVDVVGLDNLTNAFGILLLFQGIASLVGAPIAGTIADITGSYDGSFHFAGAVILLSGLMLFPLPCIQRWIQQRDEKLVNQRQSELLLSKAEA